MEADAGIEAAKDKMSDERKPMGEKFAKSKGFKAYMKFLIWQRDTLGLPDSFTNSLRDEPDDWTFVIKLHAMIETALNHLLIARFKKAELPELETVVPELANSDPKRGKIAFIKRLKLLPDEFCNFIQQFSELRNTMVHDASNFKMKLTEYVPKGGSINKWRERLTIGMRSFGMDDNIEACVQSAIANPRQALYGTCFTVMIEIFKKASVLSQSAQAAVKSTPS